jgi:hypothetical protein
LVARPPGSKRGQRLFTPLTRFGNLVAVRDPTIRDLGTLWLLHYFLSTDHEERSEAWHVLVNEFLAPGRVFTAEQYKTYFATVRGQEATNHNAVKKDPEEALDTYAGQGALSRLGILVQEGKNYRVLQPAQPPLLIAAYMLFDWWDRHYPHTSVLRLSQLAREPDSLGRVCLADSRGLEQMVRALAGHNYLTFRATEHEQVTRLYGDPVPELLDQYYGAT